MKKSDDFEEVIFDYQKLYKSLLLMIQVSVKNDRCQFTNDENHFRAQSLQNIQTFVNSNNTFHAYFIFN